MAFGMTFGAILCALILISDLLSPFGLEPAEISLIGGLFLIISVIGSIIVGAIVDRT